LETSGKLICGIDLQQTNKRKDLKITVKTNSIDVSDRVVEIPSHAKTILEKQLLTLTRLHCALVLR
jgi:hypothetical protein